MNTETYGVATFQSTHHTIQAEEVIKEKGLGYKIIPTPREITLSCGLSIIFDLNDLDAIKEMAESKEMNLANVSYEYTGGEGGWKGDVPRFSYCIDKIHAAGWEAKYTSDEALRKTIQEVLKKGAKP